MDGSPTTRKGPSQGHTHHAGRDPAGPPTHPSTYNNSVITRVPGPISATPGACTRGQAEQRASVSGATNTARNTAIPRAIATSVALRSTPTPNRSGASNLAGSKGRSASLEVLQRTGSATDLRKLSPEARLQTNMKIADRLEKSGLMSEDCIRVLKQHLSNQREAIQHDTSPQEATQAPTNPRRRQLSAASDDSSSAEEAKRHCPDAAPTESPQQQMQVDTPPLSFADALRAPPTRAPTPQAQAIASSAPDTQSSGSGNSQPARKTSNFPPLVVEFFPNWTQHIRRLRDKLGHTPNARPYGKGVRFTPKTEAEYRATQRFLSELESSEKISWFSYSLPADRSVKVAIRGLPVSTAAEEIEEELRSLGYSPEYVRPINARKGRPGCIFLAILKRTPNVTPGIYGITELLCMPGVKIEAWRGKKGPAQCHRCQQFRHSSHGCHRKLACVRCGEEHTAKDCPRPVEEPPTCANCGGAHPANKTSCPIFKREARNKKAGTVACTTASKKESMATSRTAEVVDRTTVSAEATATTLMAPANNPINRQSKAPASNKKKRKKNRGKGRKAEAPPTPQANTAEVATPTLPATTPGGKQAKKEKRPNKESPAASSSVLEISIKILTNVLVALQADNDPTDAIVRGITELLRLKQ
ncbi:uncharacterized protein LOC123666911 [Melitaea cinxia]|uniref:uncharacterized protein LOC123666911 n=1 Tax=Melitaea cinxia TaxID=113334 RepID=UPI001E272AE0|nr:uncharacterized protein LOC123666911 [Melitaea cinxia]